MDRVQVIKRETAALGGDGADELPYDAPIEPQEDACEMAGVFLQDSINRDESTLIARSGSDMTFKDGANPTPKTLTELLSGAGGLTESAHRTVLQLIHFIDEGPAEGFATGATKTVTGGLFPTLVEWKRADASLLVSKTINRSGSLVFPTPITWRLYDTDDSTVLATVTDTITYSGAAEISRSRAIA